VQAGNSWELSSVPYIPVLENVAQHAVNLRKEKVEDIMLGWTLGGYPSLNLEAFSELADDAETILRRMALRRFGESLAPTAISAWKKLSAAFREFPYHGGLLYSGPQQLGPANLLWERSTGYHASMVGFPYDDVDAWRSVYPVDVFIAQFEKVAEGFHDGARLLERKLQQVPVTDQSRALEQEHRYAVAAELHFRSTANQARFILARRALAAAKTREEATKHIAELEGLLRKEIDIATTLHRLQSIDSRIGFEASNQYYYVPADVVEKVLNCHDLLERWLPQERGKG